MEKNWIAQSNEKTVLKFRLGRKLVPVTPLQVILKSCISLGLTPNRKATFCIPYACIRQQEIGLPGSPTLTPVQSTKHWIVMDPLSGVLTGDWNHILLSGCAQPASKLGAFLHRFRFQHRFNIAAGIVWVHKPCTNPPPQKVGDFRSTQHYRQFNEDQKTAFWWRLNAHEVMFLTEYIKKLWIYCH